MKRNIIIPGIVLLCLLGTDIQAQSISKSVVAADGGSYSSSSLMVDWTIGQPVAHYASGSSYMITEGFHPVNDNSNSGVPGISKSNTLSVHAFPVPTRDRLHISIRQGTAAPVHIVMTDLTGHEVKSVTLPAQLTAETEMDMSNLAAGTYVITINKEMPGAQVMKIVKN